MRFSSKLAAIALTTGLTVAGIAGVAGPAGAATTGSTVATFTITAGVLAITVPAGPVTFSAVNTGAATAGGVLGSVTVADSRGVLLTGWTTTVTTTAYVTGTSTPNETVTPANISYSSGATTAHTGLGTFVPATFSGASGTVTYTGVAGNSSTTWDPTLTFTLLSSQVAGIYTGTITHSVG